MQQVARLGFVLIGIELLVRSLSTLAGLGPLIAPENSLDLVMLFLSGIVVPGVFSLVLLFGNRRLAAKLFQDSDAAPSERVIVRAGIVVLAIYLIGEGTVSAIASIGGMVTFRGPVADEPLLKLHYAESFSEYQVTLVHQVARVGVGIALFLLAPRLAQRLERRGTTGDPPAALR